MVENEKYQSHYDLHLRMLSYHCLQKNLIFIFLLVGVVCRVVNIEDTSLPYFGVKLRPKVNLM